MKHLVFKTLEQTKRLIVIVIGSTVLTAGVAMIVLPGPALVVIPIGMAILATEFVWARTLLVRVNGACQPCIITHKSPQIKLGRRKIFNYRH